MELPPNMDMVGQRLGGARVFEFWCYCNVLYTIGTGSMRRFQWYRPRCDNIKTHGATPKYENGGEKAWWGTGFWVLVLLQRALRHWNRLDERVPMV